MAYFKSFLPTSVKWTPQSWSFPRWIFDEVSGAPVGVLSPSASGPDGIWAPIPLTADQIANPPAQVLADINAVYMLNQAPYTRYHSTSTELTAFGDTAHETIPAGQTELRYSPLVITEATGPLIVLGTLVLRELPA